MQCHDKFFKYKIRPSCQMSNGVYMVKNMFYGGIYGRY